MRFEFKDQCWEFPSEHCVIFGILNVTPDSFSDGGSHSGIDAALQRALQLERDGADALDVGGESSRPGATPISAAEEMERVLPVIRVLKQHFQIPISIDTTKASVAETALAEGASIVNDVSGLTADPRMAASVAASGAGLILMHRRGTPETMQTLCQYKEVVGDVQRELGERFQHALRQGIPRQRIAIDPGIGFAKTSEQSCALLRNLSRFTHAPQNLPFADRPVMVGISRKSFLGGDMADRALPTLAAEMWAAQQGARFIRTHEVGPLRGALAAWEKIASATLPPPPRRT